MRSTKRLIATAAVASLAIATLAAPAAAHPRTITHTYAAVWESDGQERWIDTQAWLSTETHRGKMMTTLKKTDAAGDWVFVGRKRATYRIGWGYAATFDALAGDQECKASWRFTSENHPTLRKSSAPFTC
ncbi:MAG: hypothetical protein M3198_18590 [Actinomycetota bacterium]|nr:hypothetical protein [Actinomycetota bacterium]